MLNRLVALVVIGILFGAPFAGLINTGNADKAFSAHAQETYACKSSLALCR